LVAASNTAIIAVIKINIQTANLHKFINGGFVLFGLVRCVGILLYLVVVDETTFCCRDEVVKLSDKAENITKRPWTQPKDREERTAQRQPRRTENTERRGSSTEIIEFSVTSA
jgi:hypothetical protein